MALVTLFPSLFETQGRRVETTWGALFEEPSIVPTKQRLRGWAPAMYEADSRADGKHAVSLSALVLEVDHGTTVDQAAALWDRFHCWIYTTFSHRLDGHRFRIVLPLAHPITPGDHASLWKWSERFARRYGQEIDPSAKDAKRFWYLPGHAAGAPFEVRELGGELLDPDPLITDQLEHERTVRAASRSQCPTTATGATRSVIDRARAYLRRVAPAVSGQGGHQATWRAALVLVRGFDLDPTVALDLLRDWNRTCEPPWSERELVHKIKSAINARDVGRGYLLQRGRAA